MRTVQITGPEDLHPERPVHDMHDLASGKIDLSSLSIKDHHVEVFDLMDPEQRRAYDKLYISLAGLAKSGRIYIAANVRETLVRPDGSTGWFRYVEWTEFDTTGILGA